MKIYIFKKILENRINAMKTGAFMLSFLGLGLYESSVGPSLLDLKVAVDGTFADIVWIMPACMVGYVIGAFLIGFVLYPYINPFLCDVFSLLFSAISLALIPYNRTLVGMMLTFMATGVFLGIVDAIGHCTILLIWGKECDPFMQLLHFAFGLGGVLGPLIVSPFLVHEHHGETIDSTTSRGEEKYSAENLRIQTAFLIISIYMVCISILFFYIYLRHRDTLEHPSRKVHPHCNLNPRLNPKIHKIVICLATAFMCIYYGLEIAMAQFMSTFAYLSELRTSSTTGAMITSVYWSTYTIFQLITVFYIDIVGPEKNIIFLLTTIMIANCFLIPFGNNYGWCLWTGAAVIGIGMSSLWGSMFGYLEQYFPITNKIASGFTIFACFGELVIPNLMGLFISETPMIFMWIILSCSLAISILFAVINMLCKILLIRPILKPNHDEIAE